MKAKKVAVVGVGATGTVLAAALLAANTDTLLVGTNAGWERILRQEGLNAYGALTLKAPVNRYVSDIHGLADFNPDLVFLCTKTFHLPQVLRALKSVIHGSTMLVATQNGLGPEDLVAKEFGEAATFRMSLNYGARCIHPGKAEVTFFNPPNHLGALGVQSRTVGAEIADLLSACGLKTQAVEDIRLYVWRKMIMKCTMAAICAVTDRTIKDALNFPPTRQIAEKCFKEAVAVAGAMGYPMEKDYLEQALAYLAQVGAHKDSMCQDLANGTPTEIDFLGGKIVAYGAQKGIPTPCYVVMTNLVKALEESYLNEKVNRKDPARD